MYILKLVVDVVNHWFCEKYWQNSSVIVNESWWWHHQQHCECLWVLMVMLLAGILSTSCIHFRHNRANISYITGIKKWREATKLYYDWLHNVCQLVRKVKRKEKFNTKLNHVQESAGIWRVICVCMYIQGDNAVIYGRNYSYVCIEGKDSAVIHRQGNYCYVNSVGQYCYVWPCRQKQ